MPSPSSLDEVMKLTTLNDKTPEEVSDIWLQVWVTLVNVKLHGKHAAEETMLWDG